MSLTKRPKLLRRIRTLMILLLVAFGVFVAAIMGFLYFNMGSQIPVNMQGPER